MILHPKPQGLMQTDIAPHVNRTDFDAAKDMQPALMTVLQAVRQAVVDGPLGPLIVDTHSEGLRQPAAKPDACRLHSTVPAWAQIVVLWKFGVSNAPTDYHKMVAQQIKCSRHVLDKQPLRNLVVMVCLTMETLELLWVERTGQSSIDVSRSGQQLLSFCPQSPGFTLLVQLLATPEGDLGFRLPAEPSIPQLGQFSISELQLQCYGTAPEGHGSHVYQVTAEGTQRHGSAILKAHDSGKEVRHPNTSGSG